MKTHFLCGLVLAFALSSAADAMLVTVDPSEVLESSIDQIVAFSLTAGTVPGAVSYRIKTLDGSAIAFQDYVPINFLSQGPVASFSLTILGDTAIADPTETILFQVTALDARANELDSGTGQVSIVGVPEPSTVSLLALSLALLTIRLAQRVKRVKSWCVQTELRYSRVSGLRTRDKHCQRRSSSGWQIIQW